MSDHPSRPRPSHRRRVVVRTVAVVAAVAVGAVTSCWYLGLFTSKGRFAALDTCTLLLSPGALAPLVAHGAREPGSSRPRTLLGLGGDAWSDCKWSSVPAGQDRPFRTARVHAETKIRDGRTSAETRAKRALASWRRGHHATRAEPVDIGEGGYTTTDEMTVRILVARIVIYDVHVKFRISNALVDVSARTHQRPDGRDRALVLRLANDVAARLSSGG